MSRSEHGSTRRKVLNPKAERTNRQKARRAIDLADYENLPSRQPTRQIRHFERI